LTAVVINKYKGCVPERFIRHYFNFRWGFKTIRNAYHQFQKLLRNSTRHIIILLLLCREWYGEQRVIRRAVNHFYIYINYYIYIYNDYIILSCSAQVTDTHRRHPSAGSNTCDLPRDHNRHCVFHFSIYSNKMLVEIGWRRRWHYNYNKRIEYSKYRYKSRGLHFLYNNIK